MNAQVTGFLKANPSSNKVAISEATGIKGLPLFNLLKQMIKDGQIISQGEGIEMVYTLTESQTEDVIKEELSSSNETPRSESAVEATRARYGQAEKLGTTVSPDKKEEEMEIKEGQEEPRPKAATPRNNDKYKFNDEELGKGPLVRTIISKYVKDNPATTYKKLHEVFPASLLKRFGIVEEIEKAREISGKKYDRYFFKEEHVIKLKDKKVVVCNQLTSDNIQPFLKVARELGYIIE